MSWRSRTITPERRAELVAQRRVARELFNNWARRVDQAAFAHDPGADFDPLVDKATLKEFKLDAFACQVAAELMRQSTITAIKRAATAVRKREKR